MVNYKGIKQPVGRIMAYTGRNCLHALNKKLHHLDINRNFYALLLIEQGNGIITQQHLADLLETDKVSAGRIVNYLLSKGYIKREKNKDDRRKNCLVLTDKAVHETQGIKLAIDFVTRAVYKGISREQKSSFEKTLEQIKNNLNELNSIL